MIDTNKFNQAVLRRYQESFLPEIETARCVAERLNPQPINPRHHRKTISIEAHIDRFQVAILEDKGYENSILTRIPRAITHHIKHCMIEPGGFWKGDRAMNWKGIKLKQVRKYINTNPKAIYGRMGAVTLLARRALDPENEIERFYSDWSKRYSKELDEVDYSMNMMSKSSKSRQIHLNLYGEALDRMGDELTAEVVKILRLLRSLRPVSDDSYS